MAVITKKPAAAKTEGADLMELNSVLVRNIKDRDALNADINAVLQKIADATCPYKVGQIINTNTGLGKTGLKIDSIESPGEALYADDNRWKLLCLALTKDGKVSARVVGVMELDAPNLDIKVKA